MYAALFALPLYQTIREDIQRVVDRNRLIERANTTLSGVEEDVAAAYARRTRPEPLTGDEWARQDLNEMIGVKGIGYGGYHRLKVAAVTDDLAELVAYVAGFDIDTDEFLAIRRLISAWRDMQYVRHHAGPQDTRPTENRFLLDFDLGYRMRRLNFLQTKISEILKFDEHAKEILRCADVPEWPADRQPFEAELRAIFRSINDAFIQLRDAARNLRTTAALSAAIRNLHISGADLRELLSQPTDEQRRALVESRQDEIQAVASTIAATLRGTFDATADNVATAIQPQAALDVRSPSSVARRCLWHYFRYFDDYDMVQFPTLYGTDVGEADPVQVFRISSHDARCLVDEEAVGCRKLAGTVLGHFGAFLDPLWRQNDLLWGRLDGAERLIMAVWPSDRPSDDRTRLIGEAQAAIVAETLASLGKTQRDRLLAETFMRTNSGKPLDGGALSAFVERLKTFADPSDREILNGIDVPKLIDVYASAFEDDRRPPPQPALEAAARGTTVVGRMLDGLADRYQVRQKGLPRLLVTSGLVLWGLVAVAVPQSLPNLVARHWLGVLLLVGIVMSVIGGLFASAPGVQLHLPMWGWGVLLAGLSVALNLAIRWIGKKLRRGAADHTAPPPKRAP